MLTIVDELLNLEALLSLSFTAVAVLAVAVLCTSFIFGPLTVGSVIAGVNFNYNTMQIIFPASNSQCDSLLIT
jgi:hypothetical protein